MMIVPATCIAQADSVMALQELVAKSDGSGKTFAAWCQDLPTTFADANDRLPEVCKLLGATLKHLHTQSAPVHAQTLKQESESEFSALVGGFESFTQKCLPSVWTSAMNRVMTVQVTRQDFFTAAVGGTIPFLPAPRDVESHFWSQCCQFVLPTHHMQTLELLAPIVSKMNELNPVQHAQAMSTLIVNTASFINLALVVEGTSAQLQGTW